MSQFHGSGGFIRPSMFPPVIKWILIFNASIFVLQYLFLDVYNMGGYSLGDYFFRYFALQPFRMEEWYESTWQLISYQFMHGGFGHIFFNMFALWMFGVELENLWGSKRFIIFYLLAGIGAGLVQLFIAPMIGSAAPTVGASGSILGLLTAFAFINPDRPIFLFPLFIPIKAKYFIAFLIGLDLLMGFGSTSSGVAHFAHIGGAVSGYLLLKYGDKIGIFSFFGKLIGDFGNKSYGNSASSYSSSTWRSSGKGAQARVFKASWTKPKHSDEDLLQEEARKARNPYAPKNVSGWFMNGEQITQARIDDILDKISASGYQNLTEQEKQILFELSQKLK